MNEAELIADCQAGKKGAQRALYERYAPKMFGVCLRYVKHREDAEDVLSDAFFKVLTNLEQFRGKGSFEGWIRRIVINEALMFLRKRKPFHLGLEAESYELPVPSRVGDRLAANDILDLLELLPTGYRTIFNLYVIEGYKHREIADLLGISINTSKSQLILARKRMRELLEQADYPGVG